MSMDAVAMTPPADPRVGPHPFVGRSDRWCELPGCNRPDRNPIHDSAPAGSRILEAAKAVVRAAQAGFIIAAPGHIVGNYALSLLDQALTQAGHATRLPTPSERAMAEAARLRREQPEVYAAIAATQANEAESNARLRESVRKRLSQAHAGHTGAHIPDAMIDAELAKMDLPPDATADGTSDVLADYQHRGQ